MSLQYTLGGGGSDVPSVRREYRRRGDLLELCLRWHDVPRSSYGGNLYDEAVEMTSNVDASPDEAIALLLDPRLESHEHYHFTGYFASALINRNTERPLIIDADIHRAHYVGYRHAGILINRGFVGVAFGMKSEGVVINIGQANGGSGIEASGVFINLGSINRMFGAQSSGLIINIGMTGYSMGMHSSGILINDGTAGMSFGEGATGKAVLLKPQMFDTDKLPKDIVRNPSQAFKEYYNELIACARESPEEIGKFGSAHAIIAKVRELLERT